MGAQAVAPRLAMAESEAEVSRDIFRDNYPGVLRILLRVTGDRAQAEDLANEAFLKLHKQGPRSSAWANPSPWLYRTATNLGFDAIRSAVRRRKYETAAGSDAATAANGVVDELLRAELAGRVRAVLSRMKSRDAGLLLLRHEGHSYREIADLCGLNANSVGTLVARAEQEFRRQYIRLFGEEK